MIRLIYTLILTLASPILLLGLYKKKPGKPTVGSRWKEHFGRTPPLNHQTTPPIWVHAVSVGEVVAISPLIRKLKQRQPETNIVITTTTATGAEQASKLGDLVEHRYMPIDFGFAISGFIRAIQPKALYIVETELWPNTLHYVSKAQIPISIVNARLSERSCQRYAQFQPVFNLLSRNITTLLCQYKDDADRFIRLGIDAKKVFVTGSIKFDIRVDEASRTTGQTLRQQMGNRPVWIASSTHDGEDLPLLEAHQTLLKPHPDALLILVPRHPEHFGEVAELIRQQNLQCVTRTSQQPILPNTQVYLADTMGEMMAMLCAADICFMGGSLLGNKVGGHNLLEPAEVGMPMLTGPSYFNFKDITERLIEIEACQVVETSDDIANAIRVLLDSKENRKSQGERAKAFVNASRGAIDKSLDYLGHD